MEPFDKLAHLFEEMHFALVGVTVLVPAQDDLLGQNFGLVEQQNYLLERLHKVHVLVAELLHL